MMGFVLNDEDRGYCADLPPSLASLDPLAFPRACQSSLPNPMRDTGRASNTVVVGWF